MPALAVIAVIPEAVLVGLYGEHWRAAIPLLTPLSLATAVTGLLSLSGPLLSGVGRPGVEFRAQATAAVVTVVALVAAANFSLLALAWTLLGAFVFRFFLVTRKAIQATGTSWLAVFSALCGPLVVAALAAIIVKGADIEFAQNGLATGSRLIAAGCIGTGCLVAAILALRRWIFAGDAGWFLGRIENRLPNVIRRLFIRGT